MLKRPVTSEELERLRDERDEASRRYNDALTALDRALLRSEPAAIEAGAYDDRQVTPLNERWKILPEQALPAPRGLRSRLAHFVWSLVSPVFERQQAFNSTLVDHVNRNVGSAQAPQHVAAQTTAVLRAQSEALSAFQTHLILYLQQVTAYIDTKDRLESAQLMAVYDAAINAVTMDLLTHVETMRAREARFVGKVRAVTAAHDDVRQTLATLQQATMTVRRELERVVAGAAPAASSVAPAVSSSLDSYKYVGFEDRFRGSQSDIRARLASYVPLFAGRSDVLDVGCGRGELLDLLREGGIGARGLELNHEMAETCRARGLEVSEGDWLSHLESLPDASLGGLVAIQVVEHLDPSYLMRALDVAFHKLRPGSPIVLETINPGCWFAFFSSYIRDLTHVRPLHPDTLTYLLTASGFIDVRADYRSPYPEAEKLQPVAVPPTADADLADTVNANTGRLNSLLFTHLDYAAIGIKG
jgi:SAM-dependent methyltransferase